MLCTEFAGQPLCLLRNIVSIQQQCGFQGGATGILI